MASSASRTEAIRYLADHPDVDIALDTETTGLEVWDGRDVAIGLSLAYRDEYGDVQSFYYAIGHAVGENLSASTIDALADMLEHRVGRVFLHNAQFDLTALLSVEIDVLRTDWHDLPTMCQMINENLVNKSLDALAQRYLGRSKIAEWPWEKDFPLQIEKTTGWQNTTPRMMNDYARVDAELTLEVGEEFVTDPRWLEIRPDVWPWKRKEILALRVMRERGVLVDMQLVRELEAEGIAAKQRIEDELGLNPGSVNDREELFINRLQLPVLKRSQKTGRPSFDKTVMPLYDEILERRDEPAAKLVKEWRGWNTAVGLLLRKYREMTSPIDGRLRTEYTTHVTKTGRLSARDPNLQQISKDGGKPWNDRIKKCFVAPPGKVLISADFSQLELRIGTAYAGEQKLAIVFDEGRDIFTEMSQQLGFSRQDTKTLVYSIQYGAGRNRIQNVFNVSAKRAEEIIHTFYSTYPGFRRLNAVITEMAERDMQVPLWSGRFRHLQYKSEAYKAMNSVVQGGAADIVGRIMVRIMEELDSPSCRLLLQVHDAFVFEVDEALADEYSQRIVDMMTDVDYCTQGLEDRFDVRFAVEVTRWE